MWLLNCSCTTNPQTLQCNKRVPITLMMTLVAVVGTESWQFSSHKRQGYTSLFSFFYCWRQGKQTNFPQHICTGLSRMYLHVLHSRSCRTMSAADAKKQTSSNGLEGLHERWADSSRLCNVWLSVLPFIFRAATNRLHPKQFTSRAYGRCVGLPLADNYCAICVGFATLLTFRTTIVAQGGWVDVCRIFCNHYVITAQNASFCATHGNLYILTLNGSV